MASTPVPTSDRSLVFRRLVRLFQSHRLLVHRDAVRTWRTWTGNDEDRKEPTKESCPHVTITPGALPAAPYDLTRFRAPLTLDIDIVVDQLHADRALDIWAAFELAVAEITNDIYVETLCPAGVQRAGVRVMSPIFAIVPNVATGLLTGTGQIVADMKAPKIIPASEGT